MAGKRIFIIVGAVILVVVTAVSTFFITAGLLFGSASNFNASTLFENEEVSPQEIAKFNEVKTKLKNLYYKDVDSSELLEGAIAGMVNSLDDRYSFYYNEEAWKNMLESSSGSYVGIGVLVHQDEDNILRVIEPFENSPAEKAGLKPGDRIYKVDDIDVTGNKDSGVTISMIKGVENTDVKLTIYREGEPDFLEITITRKEIIVKNIESRQITDDIGYINIKQFTSNMYNHFKTEYDKLSKWGMKGLIIDIRNNPGGSYSEVVDIVDMIVPEGLILYTEDREGNRKNEKSDPNEINIPIAVLVNGNSASASEILAGALQDYGKAKIFGTKTFGKGVVQKVIPLGDNTGFQVTISSYFTPLGRTVHEEGITPDVLLELDDEHKYTPIKDIPPEDDYQLYEALEYIKNEVNRLN
jgi:carboxyl-terminal processing protease